MTRTERILLDKGIVPIVTYREDQGEETSFLGSGEFASAFEVLWRGKRAVARVTTDAHDVESFVRLDAVRRRLGRHGVHIRRVHRVIELKPGECSRKRRWIVVVEYLDPLPDNVRRGFWGVIGGLDPGMRSGQLSDPGIVGDILDDAFIWMSDRGAAGRAGQMSVSVVVDWASSGSSDIDSLHDALVWSLGAILPDDDLGEAVDSVVVPIEKFLTGDVVPLSSGHYTARKIARHVRDPQLVSFMSCLETLESRFGIDWSDLHSGNVMVRPGTGTWVIADPGMFWFRD